MAEAPRRAHSCRLAEQTQINTFWEINGKGLSALWWKDGQYGPRGINQDRKGRNGHRAKVTVVQQEGKRDGPAHEDPGPNVTLCVLEWSVSSEWLYVVKWLEKSRMKTVL